MEKKNKFESFLAATLEELAQPATGKPEPVSVRQNTFIGIGSVGGHVIVLGDVPADTLEMLLGPRIVP